MKLSILRYELIHFTRNKGKVLSYLFFLILCMYSIANGYGLMKKQLNTISKIENQKQESISTVTNWLENDLIGPEERPWVNIKNPYWAIVYTPSFILKKPSTLFPLGVGQSEHYGYYKKASRWSSMYDPDMVEETSNFERLANGNLDFSFLVIFLLPILLIILTHNINGLEKDLKFHKLIFIQTNGVNKWILHRLLFYFILIILTINVFIFSVVLLNNDAENLVNLIKLIFISNSYVLFFFLMFYFVIKSGQSNNAIAFKMITIWLVLCVIIPGSVHQYSSLKYPTNYMTDFLDANRKKTYDIFKLENDSLQFMLNNIYPDLSSFRINKDSIPPNKTIRRSISPIVNQLNISASKEIESQNERKNDLIRSSYFFNPITFVQNAWNSCTLTDYYSYKEYRKNIQTIISERNQLIVFELWNENTVNLSVYENYQKKLNQ